MTSLYAFLASVSKHTIFNADFGRLVGEKREKVMKEKMLQAIHAFMDNLEAVNELHHPNDFRRLYDIALLACLSDSGIPYDEMQEEFEKILTERALNRERFEKAYTEYIRTLEIAYDVIYRMRNKIAIPSDFIF